MRGAEHTGDAGLLVDEELLLPHADVDDAAAAAALLPVDEAARITVGRNAVGVIGMVGIYYGRVWDFSENIVVVEVGIFLVVRRGSFFGGKRIRENSSAKTLMNHCNEIASYHWLNR